MPPKRAPLVSTLSKKRPDYGNPYQIYTEVVNTGKNLQGTKKKVRWRFGWSDSDVEFEVELLHSVVSGKKTIIENGKEIFSSSNILASEFNYAWNSEGCNHMFRIDANLGLTSEHTYNFSIDGVNFNEMPRKPLTGTRKSLTENRYSDISNDITTRRSSAGNVDNQAKNTSKPKAVVSNSKQTDDSNSFDPFGSNDPLTSAATDPFKSATTVQTPQKTINFFDDFDDETPITNKASNDFNAFGTSNSNNSNTIAFNLFDDNFSTTSSTAATRGTVGSTTTDDFYSATSTTRDSFTSLPSNKSTSTAFGIRSQPTTGSSVASSDVFSTSNATASFGFDAFAPSQAKTVPKRTSAQDIVLDFEGLTVNPTPPTITSTEPIQSKNEISANTEPAVEETPVESGKPSDPWSTGLVNLDLTKHSNKTSTSNLKSNVQVSQPLKTIVQNTNAPMKPVFNTPPPAPFYANPPPPNAFPPNPFASTQPIIGQVPPRNPFAPPNAVSPSQPYDPFMTIQPRVVGLAQTGDKKSAVGFNGTSNIVQSQPIAGRSSITSLPQQPKSSLDSIDWRN